MSSNVIYPQGGGGVDITVPAGESIAIYTKDEANVLLNAGYPNMPDSYTLTATVQNEQTVLGPYTDGAVLQINAGAAEVLYAVGASPSIIEQKGARIQGTPGVLNATGTLTAEMILSGIVTSTTAAGVTATLDTGAIMESAGEFAVGDSFDWSAINTGANAFTVTAAASGHTVVGDGAVAAGESGVFRTRKTDTDTFVTYRVG